MNDTARAVLVVTVVLLSSAFAASCLLALAGDPQSVWLWRDVLKVIR